MQSGTTAPRPLEGVKVIELSHLIAGPYCCQLLAGEGADVVKVEPPQGELARDREPLRRGQGGTLSAHFAALNRGKRSLALDLKNPQGMATFRLLLKGADVLVTNMRGGALERLGIHPSALHVEFPRLVIASISGFGLERSGKYADRAGLAMVAEALSGTTSLTRDHSGNPVWCGFALGDIASGMTAHAAILLALRIQEKHGKGQVLDLTLAECMLPMVSVALARVQIADADLVAKAGANDYHGVPYGAYRAADGYVNIGVNSDVFWRRLCTAMDRPELGADPRFATYLERVKYQDEVNHLTEEFTRAHTREQITEKLNKVDVPVASILSMHEVLASDFFKARGSLREVGDGIGGKLTLPVDPTWFEADPEGSHLPRLGEHREEILNDLLGMSGKEIEELTKAGAFGA